MATVQPTATALIPVLLVDDHTVVRQGTQSLLEASGQFKVMGSFADGETFLAQWQNHQPVALILLDINLPGKNGLAFVQPLRQAGFLGTLVVFSAFEERPYVERAKHLGVDGYLSKGLEPADFTAALLAIMQGEACLHNLLEAHSGVQGAACEGGSLMQTLSAREKETLYHVAQGLTNRQIAEKLVVAVKTVDAHVAKLIKKLQVQNRSQLTALAYDYGLL